MNIENKCDDKYFALIEDIKSHEEFRKTRDIVHHGMNRYDHSLRVSYYSYKITKVLGLNYQKTARGAMLHDFFFEENEGSKATEKANTMLKHPKYALENAMRHFELSDIEKDIIVTHMFPVAPMVPKYMESWIVDVVDDFVSVFEKLYSMRREFSAATSFMFLVLTNYFR